jgi:multidrug efflux pump
MNLTDLFIRRPVLSIVVSLLVLVFGIRAVLSLPVLQYPRTENTTVTVTTAYYGADPDVVAGFITTPLELAISQANGIDYISSTSLNGLSTIKVYLRLNYDSARALTEINTKVNSVRNQLPPQSELPVITVEVGQTIAAMYIGFNSDILPQNNITDYLVRVVQPQMQSVQGVQTADILGAQNFALRAWLDPAKLAAYNLTAADVRGALAANNYISGVGTTKGQMVQVSLATNTGLRTLEEFKQLIVKQADGAIVRLADVANVLLGSEDYETRVGFNGKDAVYIGIKVAPGANLLEVTDRIRSIFPDIQKQLPSGLYGEVVYDSTVFVNSSIHEVVKTLIEALVIVTLVVFLFLGSPRSALITVIAIPLSLIGTFIVMLMLGFTINLLTLLALVLAIGLVVDDAIVVVENVNRHLEDGMKPLDAALTAARELLGPIIAMTIVLIAVYLPIGFQGGLTGALFTEFAFTLAGAVTVSAVIALTLTPMMSAKLLRRSEDLGGWERNLIAYVDRTFDKLRHGYERRLTGSLNYLPVTAVFAAIVLGSIYFFYSGSQHELAPQEDQGVIFGFGTSAPNSTLQQRRIYADEVFKTFHSYPETSSIFQLDLPGTSIGGMVLKPWEQRERTTNEMQPIVQNDLSNKVPGQQIAVFQPPSLPGTDGLPVQFVIKTTQNFSNLNEVADTFLQEALKSGRFIFLDSDLKYDLPQARLVIDRDKAAQLGLTMNDIGGAMASMLGGGYVNYFSMAGRSYKVIPQVEQISRLNPEQLGNYYIRTGNGTPVPLSTVAKIETEVIPRSLNHFQQQNSATISGVPFPGVSLGDAVSYLDNLAKETLPTGYSTDYGGQSRQFKQESAGLVILFGLALVIIFLALSAQFESFRDPLIILISVPLSIAGALLFIFIGLGGASLNIYTQVGLVTLMGLISKNGILITEFANKLQEQGLSKREAIVQAATIRLRPILMTTAATVLGVIPLLLASGAGAVSRFNMGLVIASGMTIGTFFTLFVVPAVYVMVAADHHTKRQDAEDTTLQPAE